MKYFKKINNLPSIDLFSTLIELLDSNKICWSDDNQICLNSVPDDPNNFLLGSGSLTYDWDNKITYIDNGIEKVVVNKFENPKKEEDFTLLCDVFKGTAFEEIFNLLTTKYKTGRIRIMKSKPKTCLSWHVDSSPRIHYPIKTQEGCLMVIDNQVCHLTENTWWWTDTVLPHTAFNASKEDRIHLVAVLLDKE